VKRKWLGIAVLLWLVISPLQSYPQATQQTQPTPNEAQQKSRAKAKPTDTKSGTPPASSGASSEENSKPRSYTNSSGQRVQSPKKSSTVPKGASAQCRDGSYSFSQSRRGTCSHHGGVSRWLTQ